DEEGANHDHVISLKYILEDIKNIQTNIHYVRTDSCDTEQQLSSLSKKISYFRSMILTIYQGINLLQVAANTATKYAGSLLRMLFAEHEL
ncbi:unnamed protein product, partial [Adineta steineri]